MKETLWQRLLAGSRRLRQGADWDRFAGTDWPDRIMSVPVTDRFHAKQGRSTGRWILHHADQRLGVYLKRHYRLPWWQRLLATLWPGRGWTAAMREWRNLQWAQAQGLPVPRPLAAGEFIGPWGRLQSFLAVEELTGMVPLHEAIPAAAGVLDPAAFRCWKAGLIEELARLARALHERRYFHKDLYLCHFFIRKEDIPSAALAQPVTGPAWRGRVHLIDLHRLTWHPWTAPIWRVKDLAQLLYSSEIAGVAVRDRLRFWRAYVRGEGRSRWLRRLVLWKWQRYRRHNTKQQARLVRNALEKREVPSRFSEAS